MNYNYILERRSNRDASAIRLSAVVRISDSLSSSPVKVKCLLRR